VLTLLAVRTEPRARPSPPVQDEAAQARATISALGRKDFLERLAGLVRAAGTDAANPGSYGCTDCERCADCMFCKSCDACHQCTHCTRCELCNNCSHCVDCKNCHACAYCLRSENCSASAYLVMSRNLADCTYCFGCVGLSRKDFHILNVSFGRTEYFEITKRLRAELDLPR
jgi:hypothetical protein